MWFVDRLRLQEEKKHSLATLFYWLSMANALTEQNIRKV
jgi:hypothetical protein